MRKNRSVGLKAMLAAWDDPSHPLNGGVLTLARSRYGNINTDGNVASCTGLLLPRWHAKFMEAIEPGVRELVSVLIDAGWATYSSCEGHVRGEGRAPVERNVGLVGRTFDEFLGALVVLAGVAEEVNSQGPVTISVDCKTAALENDGWTWPAVELWFIHNPDTSWRDYFATLDEVCSLTVSKIRATMALSTAATAPAPGAAPVLNPTR